MFHCLWSTDERHCNQKFAHKFNLRVHLRVHSLDKVCACPFCGAMFTNNTKLSDHVLRRQSSEFSFHIFLNLLMIFRRRSSSQLQSLPKEIRNQKTSDAPLSKTHQICEMCLLRCRDGLCFCDHKAHETCSRQN